jgi:hypothetical protein
VPKTRPPARPYCSPAVRDLIDKAKPGDRLSALLKYKPGVKPTEAVAAYQAAAPGLEVSPGYPPVLHVKGDKDSLHKALGHELTVGVVKDYQEYTRDLLPAPGQRR